jgi:DNA-binding SARP family transcriptional activator
VSVSKQRRRLEFRLFGPMTIFAGDGQPSMAATRAVQGLAAYLLHHRGRLHSRETLACLYWPDLSADRSRSCLSTTLWRLRRIVEPDGVPRGSVIRTGPAGDLGINPSSDLWLDVAAVEAYARRALDELDGHWTEHDLHGVESGLAVYRGDLLEGFYDNWAVAERERVRQLYCDAELCVMRQHGLRGSLPESLASAHRILRADPLREDVHRELIALYLGAGQPALAARQLEACRTTLRVELGVAPAPETEGLLERIRPTPSSNGSGAPPAGGDALAAALSAMSRAVDELTRARADLGRALRRVHEGVT